MANDYSGGGATKRAAVARERVLVLLSRDPGATWSRHAFVVAMTTAQQKGLADALEGLERDGLVVLAYGPRGGVRVTLADTEAAREAAAAALPLDERLALERPDKERRLAQAQADALRRAEERERAKQHRRDGWVEAPAEATDEDGAALVTV